MSDPDPPTTRPAAEPNRPQWAGFTASRVCIERQGPASVVTSQYATAPLKLLCPRPADRQDSPAAWIYLSSFGGGLLAGDRLSLDVTVRAGARAVLTTQASTKIYHSNAEGTPASQRMYATVARGALLVVAPEPLVCFADAVYEQSQEFHLERGAGLVLLDWFTAGRVKRATGPERWAFRRLSSRNRVWIASREVWHDALVLDRTQQPIDNPLTVGPHQVLATLLMIGPPTAEWATQLHDQLHRQPLDRKASLQFGLSRRGGTGDEVAEGPTTLTLRLAGDCVETVQQELARLLEPLTLALGRGLWHRKN